MCKIKTIVLLALFANSLCCFAGLDISFRVAMEQPNTHLYTVKMNVKGIPDDTLVVKLPVWAPGYYKIMDYPINLIGFKATNNIAKPLSWQKNSKNTWIVNSLESKEITIEYKIYSFTKSVAGCYLDSEKGFICPTGLFMYVDGNLNNPSKIIITPFKDWNKVSTGLSRLPESGFVLQADNFDQLYDCPILLGNHIEYKFDVENIPYTIAYSKQQKSNPDSVLEDLIKIIQTSTDTFSQIPFDNYTFIIMENGRGGLEHQNSMAIFSDIPDKSDSLNYKDWLSFITHEFFHLYNEKAIRPINLGPFDYEKENYTNMLWVSEGFTVYYENRILLLAGLINEEDFLENMSMAIRDFENSPGCLYQSAAQSSFDAWIDFFRFKETKPNYSISYYDKGCALGMLIDLKIRHETKNEKSPDNVMQNLFNEFYLNKKRGFTDNEFRCCCEEIAGCELNEIFDRYVATTASIDYPTYLGYAGFTIDTALIVLPGAYLGADLTERNNKVSINFVWSGCPAEKAGLSCKDEIIKFNDKPVKSGMCQNILNTSNSGDEMFIVVHRNGEEKKLKATLTHKTTRTFKIQEDTNQKKSQELTLKNWLYSKY